MMQHIDRGFVIIQGYTTIMCYDIDFCYDITAINYYLIQIKTIALGNTDREGQE